MSNTKLNVIKYTNSAVEQKEAENTEKVRLGFFIALMIVVQIKCFCLL